MTHAIYIDTGTTNTRVWRMRDGEIQAHAETMVGVRDSAREGSTAKLRATLRDLIAEVQTAERATEVIAAGMITSALGLVDVPHIPAPAGLAELAAHTRRYDFPDITPLPVWLVPGVRSGPAACDAQTVATLDIMRGEETLCAGLVALKIAPASSTVLNLGSHWKAIQLAADGRVTASVTSLTGEMIHTTQTQTILSSAVPHERLSTLDFAWAQAGLDQARQAGLPRALFCVRLLEQKGNCTPEERLAFLVGAFLTADLEGLQHRGLLTPTQQVLITGGGALAELWERVLKERNIASRIVTAAETETAMLTGLRRILERVGTAE